MTTATTNVDRRSTGQWVGPALFGITVALCLFWVSGPATAGHSDNGSAITFERDNNSHYWAKSQLTGAGRVACNWGAGHFGNGNEVTMYEWQSGDQDVICFDGDYNEPWFGFTTCYIEANSNTCDLYKIQFDLDYGQIDGPSEQGYYEYIGCHEFGHTSSMGHRVSGEGSCMIDGSGNRLYDNHDDEAVNADYP